MADDIIQRLILQPGQSQSDRMPKELGTHFVEVDERETGDLLVFAQKLAKSVNYYRGDAVNPAGDWTPFFPSDQEAIQSLLESKDAAIPPHMALFLSFLELYKRPQDILNSLSGRHLDFYYRDVLRLTKKTVVPDKAHLLIELKKQSPPVRITPADVFSAGKDSSGAEVLYVPTGELVVNGAKVDSLRSLFVDPSGGGTVRYAPVANSSDGVGGKLSPEEPKWRAFGHQGLAAAEVGFAVASPVLRMKEGIRRIAMNLSLSGVKPDRLNSGLLRGAFEAYITGEKNWVALHVDSVSLGEGLLQFALTVPEAEGAVIDYDQSVHGYAYTARAPVIQLLLRPAGAGIGYRDFQGLTVDKVQVLVDVANVVSLNLESDGGVLDARKVFIPFGPQPGRGSQFFIGHDEALSKKLSELRINLQWKDAPISFSTLYGSYGISGISNDSFTAAISFRDGGSWVNETSAVRLFESGDASAEHVLVFAPGTSSISPGISPGMNLFALSGSRSSWANAAAEAIVLRSPVLGAFKTRLPEPRTGFITVSLEKDFLHSKYRQDYVKHVMNFSKGVESRLVILNEPYTPAIQRISLSYKAHSDEVAISSAASADFANPDVEFYHVAYFGQMREHGFQRGQFSFLTQKRVSLLPVYEHEGELLVGIKDLSAGDSLSILFQVAQGSADPVRPRTDIDWAVLCDNYWKPLGAEDVVLDTTNRLLSSGIVRLVIPGEASVQNSILPAGLIWLRAGIVSGVEAVCQLIEVAANAVEVRRASPEGGAPQSAGTLEAGKITKLKNGRPDVKAVSQPYASFGGSQEEGDENFHRRIAERLRHKNRCVSPWDYERMVLDAFPELHKVKCVPHAKDGLWLAPGNVLIVVVADLKNQNAIDPLQPKVDADTLGRIADFVRDHAGMQVQVTVKNPSYQRIQLDFGVKFRPGYEFNFYREDLKRQLTRFLSPWAFESEREIAFGGKIYKSVLLDFVEELEAVDYVTDFKMYASGRSSSKIDVNEAQPESPDAILVSDYTHVVNPAR